MPFLIKLGPSQQDIANLVVGQLEAMDRCPSVLPLKEFEDIHALG